MLEWESSLGEGRERKEGAKGKRREEKIRETKIGEARKQIRAEVREDTVQEIGSLGALGERWRWVFRGSGRFLGEV